MDYNNTLAPHNPTPSGQAVRTKILAITGIPIGQTWSGGNRQMGIDVRFSSVGYL